MLPQSGEENNVAGVVQRRFAFLPEIVTAATGRT
jgi:hypothetical protein